MTRLFYEKMVLDKFPDLLWVRVCTSAPYTITVYACDAEMSLSDANVTALKQFLSKHGMASCVHNVKHYFELQNDEAFPIGQVPDRLKEVALLGNVSQAGVQSALKAAFPLIDPDRLDIEKDVVTFHLSKDVSWTPYQRKFAELMLTEILPAGSTAKLADDSSKD